MAGVVELPRAFAVGFRDLQLWNVASQFFVKWEWPNEMVCPLESGLKRRLEPIVHNVPEHEPVTLLTIHFDGSIEPREPIRQSDIKGKLFRVLPDDVVFSKIDVRNGAIGLAPEDISNACVTSEFPVYSVDANKVLPQYVKLLFRTKVFMRLLNSMISGASGRKRIQPSQLESVEVPIPPLPVQQKIVDYWQEARQAVENAKQKRSDLVDELHDYLVSLTPVYFRLRNSRMFVADFSQARQWDGKAGRAAAFRSANPSFVRLGDYTEECTELVRPWDNKDKKWPVYGVNNKVGVFLSVCQLGKDFNAPYKHVEKNWFFHNPTRANVGSLGIVPKVFEDAVTSPEYQVWKLIGGFSPGFMALMLQTEYFLTLVSFSRVGGVKQRMYYANLAEIHLPMIKKDIQKKFADTHKYVLKKITNTESQLQRRKQAVEEMILGLRPVNE